MQSWNITIIYFVAIVELLLQLKSRHCHVMKKLQLAGYRHAQVYSLSMSMAHWDCKYTSVNLLLLYYKLNVLYLYVLFIAFSFLMVSYIWCDLVWLKTLFMIRFAVNDSYDCLFAMSAQTFSVDGLWKPCFCLQSAILHYFTMRCTIVQSTVLQSHVVCPTSNQNSNRYYLRNS